MTEHAGVASDGPGRGRAGRRAGTSTTRAAIAAAAQDQFAAHGYDRASLRGIAREAGVDPALITYFFGSKQRLFAEVVELPADPRTVLAQVTDGDPAGVGRRMATVLAGILDDDDARVRFVAIIRSAAQSEEVAAALRERLTRDILEPVAARVREGVRPQHAGPPDEDAAKHEARLRAGLVMSQVAGMIFARHVIGLEALTEASSEELVRALAPTFQRYLAEEL